MGHFTWSPENEVFISQIDAEHRGLFQIGDELEQAIEAGAPPAVVQEHLRNLKSHIEDHFAHEEWLMQSVAYPSYGWHKEQHETVRRRLRLLIPLVDGGDAEAGKLLLEFLAHWLQDHSGVTDRMMAAHVRNYERAHATNAFERWGTAAEAAGAPRRHSAPGEPEAIVRTLRLCKTCGVQTTHELRPEGLVCKKCAERSVSADLDRD